MLPGLSVLLVEADQLMNWMLVTITRKTQTLNPVPHAKSSSSKWMMAHATT
jgi:hypothetical protein